MSNFIAKSKDMFAIDPGTYAHFSDIYKHINRLSRAKQYMNCDLHNIEEVLSILEMESFIGGEQSQQLEKPFQRFIADVINYYTPKIEPYVGFHGGHFPNNWHSFVFGNDHIQRYYGTFIASLLNLRMSASTSPPIQLCIRPGVTAAARYGVISLNYDSVIENYLGFTHREFEYEDENYGHVRRNPQPGVDCFENRASMSLATVHGSVITQASSIIAPTWNKGNIPDASIWKLAENLISQANYIRFLGYSLPQSDSYALAPIWWTLGVDKCVS